jgi:ribosomal protein S27AE
MTLRRACKNCGGSIALDAADFAEQKPISTLGQNVCCPHCGVIVANSMSAHNGSAKSIKAARAIIAILTLVTLLVPAVIVFSLIRSGINIRQIMTGGAGAPG